MGRMLTVRDQSAWFRLSLRKERAITAASATSFSYSEPIEPVGGSGRGSRYFSGLRPVSPDSFDGGVVGGPDLFAIEHPAIEASTDTLSPVVHLDLARGAGLTARDVMVLGYLASGWTTAEIARELVYAESTIKKEVHLIVHRLGARNRTHAVALAVRGSLI